MGSGLGSLVVIAITAVACTTSTGSTATGSPLPTPEPTLSACAAVPIADFDLIFDAQAEQVYWTAEGASGPLPIYWPDGYTVTFEPVGTVFAPDGSEVFVEGQHVDDGYTFCALQDALYFGGPAD